MPDGMLVGPLESPHPGQKIYCFARAGFQHVQHVQNASYAVYWAVSLYPLRLMLLPGFSPAGEASSQ